MPLAGSQPCPITSTWLCPSAYPVSSPPAQKHHPFVPSISHAHRPFISQVRRPLRSQARRPRLSPVRRSWLTQACGPILSQVCRPLICQAHRLWLTRACRPLRSQARLAAPLSPTTTPLSSPMPTAAVSLTSSLRGI